MPDELHLFFFFEQTIQAKATIGEREGKLDNKTRIEVIKEEQRKIAEEILEEKMLEESILKAKAEELIDTAVILDGKNGFVQI